MKEQQRNRRNNRLLTVNGKTACVAEWAETTGIPADRIYSRLREGWSDEDSVLTPNKRPRRR
jgi:hypothetical protein